MMISDISKSTHGRKFTAVMMAACVLFGMLTACENQKKDDASADTTEVPQQVQSSASPEPEPVVEELIPIPDKDRALFKPVVEYYVTDPDFSQATSKGLMEIGVSLPKDFYEPEFERVYYAPLFPKDTPSSKLHSAVVEGVWQYSDDAFLKPSDFDLFIQSVDFDLTKDPLTRPALVSSEMRAYVGGIWTAVCTYKCPPDQYESGNSIYYGYAIQANSKKKLVSYIQFTLFYPNEKVIEKDVIELMFESAVFLNLNETDTRSNTVENIEDWKKLGLPENDVRIEYIKAFLNADKEKFESLSGVEGLYNGFETLKISKYTITREDQKTIFGGTKNISAEVLFKFEVSESNFEPIGICSHAYYVHYNSYYDTCSVSSAEAAAPLSEAQQALSDLFDSAAGYDIKDMDLTEYIICQIRKETVGAEDIRQYAKTYFGLENFEISDWNKFTHPDGSVSYEVPAHGGHVIFFEHIGEATENGDTIATVQFYADEMKLIKSHTVEYRMRKIGDKWAFLDSVVIYRSQYEPYEYYI